MATARLFFGAVEVYTVAQGAPTTTSTTTTTTTISPPPTSGLVYHYDLTNASSYPGSGTTVTNLGSGAGNLTIYGSGGTFTNISGSNYYFRSNGAGGSLVNTSTLDSSLTGNQDMTIIMVGNRTGVEAGTSNWFLGTANPTNGYCGYDSGISATRSMAWNLWADNSVFPATGGNKLIMPSTSAATTTFALYAMRCPGGGAHNAATVNMWVDGEVYTTTSGTYVLDNSSGGTPTPNIGTSGISMNGYSTTSAGGEDCAFVAFLVYNRQLSDSEVQGIQNYYVSRGITIQSY
jgi:hypothetical protein